MAVALRPRAPQRNRTGFSLGGRRDAGPGMTASRLFCGLLGALVLTAACGKKGDPMPPLVRVPAAPQQVTAARQAGRVTVRFVVPSANIDNSTPGDVARVEVLAMNGAAALTPEDVVRRGTVIGVVKVNPPPDPDEEPVADPPPASPPDGIDQGGAATIVDTLSSSLIADDLRTYVAVAVSPRGRRGTPSTAAVVPLVMSPAPPPEARIEYDASGVTLTWSSDAEALPVHVYELGETERRLTETPLADGRYVDARVEFDTERCYATRAVLTVAEMTIEGERSAPSCVTPRDTFAPPAPTGLNAVPETGAVSLIWNPVDAADLAGYIVMRAVAPATEPVAVNETPIADTTYRDGVPAGVRVRYVIVAVDRSGNRSAASPAIEETAR
jgi:hypothetical protein